MKCRPPASYRRGAHALAEINTDVTRIAANVPDLSLKEELVVATARRLLPFGVALMLGACASEPTPNPTAIIVPGPGKDGAAFQQDDVICRSHAATGTGYGDLSQRPTVGAPAPGSSGTTPTPGPLAPMGAPAAVPLGGIAAVPALPSTGVAMANNPAASSPEPPEVTGSNAVGYLQCMAARGDRVQFQPPYANAGDWYDYPYSPYAYDYPYGVYGAGFIGVFGVGGFHHGQFHRAFFNRGGFHMAGLHGGFHGGGFHGGGHGGGSHGGGGHR
jgi:hypothetical protein